MENELFFTRKNAFGLTDLVCLLRAFEVGLDQRLCAIEAEVKRLSGDVKLKPGGGDEVWP